MKHKQRYVAPAILRQTALDRGCELLSGSIVDGANVVSMGQNVEDLNFTPNNTEGFNFNWEDAQ